MQWAYGRAGVGLPRTSQAQRNAGRHVSLSEARPGDLVIYRDDASHVGMYVGNGQVVHAPYPGARVRYDPANMMPISSITRPLTGPDHRGPPGRLVRCGPWTAGRGGTGAGQRTAWPPC
ncbi:hypothetical protein GCM10020221_27900 [Streptomyces thioluteus]|uniref:NlpC/P60 domain-containing protein n=1 Tax=Streptomyces thioluteus TaxID=66431 RepID=A0ABP6JG06_STRTU